MKKLVLGRTPLREPLFSLLLLPPRLAVGLGIALGFGVPKIHSFGAYVEEVALSGAPVPVVLALGLLAAELIAGSCLALGLATRLSAVTLALAMAGILAVPNQGAFPWDVTPFLLGGYLFTITGAGRYSLDSLLESQRITSSLER